jgi:hypothetical protein
MTAALVTYAQAKAHLRLPDDREQEDVEAKTQQATAMVLRHIEREENDWDDTTDPTVDLDFAIVQAAILETLGDLWRFRGDDADQKPELVEEGAYLKANVRRKLHPLRRPSLA